MFIVELEEGVWLADGIGDPSRTLDMDDAKRFKWRSKAKYALLIARKYRPFLNAKIIEVDS